MRHRFFLIIRSAKANPTALLLCHSVLDTESTIHLAEWLARAWILNQVQDDGSKSSHALSALVHTPIEDDGSEKQ